MNSFRWISTAVVKSEMDFTKAKKDSVFSGDVNLSVTTKTPKDAEKNRTIYCSVTLSLGEEHDSIKIWMKTLSKFEIEELDDPDTLREDSRSYCPSRAVEETLKKMELLTEAHLGKAVHISLPPDME